MGFGKSLPRGAGRIQTASRSCLMGSPISEVQWWFGFSAFSSALLKPLESSAASNILAAGWRLLMAPIETATPDTATKVLNVHPDPRLAIPGNEYFGRLRSEAENGAQFVRAAEFYCGWQRSGSCSWRSMPAPCR